MGFPGLFRASTAPAVAKATMNVSPTTLSRPFPLWPAWLAGSGCTAS
jgi:hypothetical protein